MNQKRKKKLNRNQTKKLLPAIKAFNKMAGVFIDLLNKQVEAKEAKLNRIRVLAQKTSTPIPNNYNISIIALDINQTMVKTNKTGYKKTKKMEWEKGLRGQNRGIIL